MSHALDARPLPVRLQKRIEKYDLAHRTSPLATDVHLHRQSLEEISRLTIENERLRTYLERTQMLKDAPLLKNYRPFRDTNEDSSATEQPSSAAQRGKDAL